MRACALTMVYNEPFFLKLWHRYYAEHFGADNLYVIDHGSTDGSTSFLGPKNVQRIKRLALDEAERAALISEACRKLLDRYDVVVFGDADEIVVADPAKYRDLNHYLSENTSPLIAPLGLALLHVEDAERRMDVTAPVLRQRSWVRYHRIYSKPIIARAPVQWKVGFHEATTQAVYGRDVYLFHLKAMDKTVALAELARKCKVRFSDLSMEDDHGFQWRFNKRELDEVFFSTKASHLGEAIPFESLRHRMPHALKIGRFAFGPLARVPDRFHEAIPGVPRASLIARAVERIRGWRAA